MSLFVVSPAGQSFAFSYFLSLNSSRFLVSERGMQINVLQQYNAGMRSLAALPQNDEISASEFLVDVLLRMFVCKHARTNVSALFDGHFISVCTTVCMFGFVCVYSYACMLVVA